MGCCLCPCLAKRLGGDFLDERETFLETQGRGLSLPARHLINESFADIDPTLILDVHCHLLGMFPKDSGCYVHENMEKCCHCTSYIKAKIMFAASGFDPGNPPTRDDVYYLRLVSLYENFIPTHIQHKCKIAKKQQRMENENKNENKNEDGTDEEKINLYQNMNENKSSSAISPIVMLLGLDEVYNLATGLREPHHTSVHTPAKYVLDVCNKHKNVFSPGVSIHPYRKDCLELLEFYHENGCKLIKWLPNSMGIDPSNPICDVFYDKLIELDMFLLTHTGTEHSLDDAGYTFQIYGNPLLYRKALDKGVKIIMAHCASEGSNIDFDVHGQPNTNGCDLFLRLMREEKYSKNLYGDISALTTFRRIPALLKVMKAEDIHHRLIFGSDYPVPCVKAIVWYSKLVGNGLLSQVQSDLLQEIFEYNPLLADYVTKRCLRLKDEHGKEFRFADCIFQQAPLLNLRKSS